MPNIKKKYMHYIYMNLRKDLQDANVKSAVISSLLFFILAFPELFQAVDSLLRKVVGGKFMNMHLVVLVIHSVLFGVMFYYINQFLQRRVLVEGQQTDIAKPSDSCIDALQICKDARAKSTVECDECAGNHQSQLESGGCTSNDVMQWCRSSSPPGPSPPPSIGKDICVDNSLNKSVTDAINQNLKKYDDDFDYENDYCSNESDEFVKRYGPTAEPYWHTFNLSCRQGYGKAIKHIQGLLTNDLTNNLCVS